MPLRPVQYQSIGHSITMNADLNKIILSAEEISARIREIAEDINRHHQMVLMK